MILHVRETFENDDDIRTTEMLKIVNTKEWWNDCKTYFQFDQKKLTINFVIKNSNGGCIDYFIIIDEV